MQSNIRQMRPCPSDTVDQCSGAVWDAIFHQSDMVTETVPMWKLVTTKWLFKVWIGRVRGHRSGHLFVVLCVSRHLRAHHCCRVVCRLHCCHMGLPTTSATRHLCCAFTSSGTGMVPTGTTLVRFTSRQRPRLCCAGRWWTRLATQHRRSTCRMSFQNVSCCGYDLHHRRRDRERIDHLHGQSCFGGCCRRCRMSRRCIPTGSGRTPANCSPSINHLSTSPRHLSPEALDAEGVRSDGVREDARRTRSQQQTASTYYFLTMAL